MVTLVEKINQSVRGVVTLGLVAGFIFGFLAGRISGEVYTNVVSLVIGFWFATRSLEKAQQASAPTPVEPRQGAT